MISPTEFIMSIGSESILFAHKADLLLKDEQVDKAVELCGEGVKRFPFYAEGFVQLARSYQMSEEDELAIEAYKNALFLQPGHSKALKGLAYLYYKLRKKEAGEQTLLSAYLYDSFDNELHEFLESEGLLSKIYTPPAFEEDYEEETKEEETAFDLEEILDDARLTPEDERKHIIDEINEQPAEKQDEMADNELFPEIDASKPGQEPSEEEDSHFDFDSGLMQDDFESDFFPEDLSDITPGVGEISEEEMQEETPEEELSGEEKIESPKSEEHEGKEFSAWMNDLFKTDEQTKDEETVKPEQPKPDENLIKEEHPVLDTALIFAKRRNSELADNEEKDEKEENKEKEEKTNQEKEVADFNTLEDDIERISSKEATKIEESMIEPLSETSEELDEVIKRIQESTEKRKDDSDFQQLEFDRQQAKAVEDEAVNIEDILNNPSLLTPTFGEILIAQHKFDDALKVFNALAKKDPDNLRFRKKIEFLNKLVSAHK